MTFVPLQASTFFLRVDADGAVKKHGTVSRTTLHQQLFHASPYATEAWPLGLLTYLVLSPSLQIF